MISFITTLCSAQSVHWLEQTWGPGYTQPSFDVTVEGYVTVASDYLPWQATVGDTALPSSTSSKAFLARYNSDGDLIWALAGVHPDSFYDNTIDAMATALDGTVYVAGRFENKITLGAQTIVASDVRDAFVASISKEGDVLWLERIACNRSIIPSQIVVDSKSNIYMTGGSLDSINYQGVSYPGDFRQGSSTYLIKLNSQGELMWNNYGLSIGHMYLSDDDHLLIYASYQNLLSFGGVDHGEAQRSDLFCSTWDLDGNLLELNTWRNHSDMWISGSCGHENSVYSVVYIWEPTEEIPASSETGLPGEYLLCWDENSELNWSKYIGDTGLVLNNWSMAVSPDGLLNVFFDEREPTDSLTGLYQYFGYRQLQFNLNSGAEVSNTFHGDMAYIGDIRYDRLGNLYFYCRGEPGDEFFDLTITNELDEAGAFLAKIGEPLPAKVSTEESLYPNPFLDHFNLNINSVDPPYVLDIYDAHGRFRESFQIKDYTQASLRINTSDWRSGLYVGHIATSDKSSTFKIIKL